MREIKFRAWSVDRNTMLQVGDDFGTDHPLDCVVYAKNGQNVVLMQYTGLKDKNGKEIYEGDILRYRSGGNLYESEVSFNSDCGCYVVNEKTVMLLDHAKRHAEVVGNIFESTE